MKKTVKIAVVAFENLSAYYSQLSPCRHPTITDTPIIQTAVKSLAKTNNRRLTE